MNVMSLKAAYVCWLQDLSFVQSFIQRLVLMLEVVRDLMLVLMSHIVLIAGLVVNYWPGFSRVKNKPLLASPAAFDSANL